LDAALKQIPAGSRYATLLVARWCPESSRFEISNGGAPKPILLRGGELSYVEATGTPVGLPTPADFDSIDLPVVSGDLLVFYSDGIPDQPGPDGRIHGEARLADVISDVGGEAVDVVAATLLADLERFRAGVEQHDDQMVLVIRVK
jgi:sigma-B regulation protein RsbU (phosphoserine phosphatase)